MFPCHLFNLAPKTAPSRLSSRAPAKNIPDELIIRILAFSAEPHRTKLINKEWRHLTIEASKEMIASYLKNPLLASLIQKRISLPPETLTPVACDNLLEQILVAVRERAKASLTYVCELREAHLSTLLKKIEKTENEVLRTFFERLITQIPRTNPARSAKNLFQKSNQIREWMQNNQGMLNGLNTLNLSCLDLRILPNEITHFSGLEVLLLPLNRLERFPTNMKNLLRLHTLDLRDNSLNSLPLGTEQLGHLKALDLSDNLFSTFPKEISGFTLLHTLIIDNCHLAKLSSRITLLVHLEVLSLNHNKLESLPENIDELPLRALYVAHNRISTLPSNFQNLALLEELDLSHNHLNEEPTALKELPSLQYLDLQNNPFCTPPS